MIEKPAILITSTGRTGTEFFAKLFADIIPDCTSLHEPDIVKFPGIENRLEHYANQTRRAGIWRMVFLKALGQWTLAAVSDARFRGSLDVHAAMTKLHSARADFVSKMPGFLYVESNLGYYGLLDITSQVFRNHRAIYVVRDGRDWVRSMVNWGEVYGKTGLRKLFAHEWPAASDIAGDPLAESWKGLPRFDRLCWAWARLNEYALTRLSKNPDARLFHFEKIFAGKNRYDYLDDLVSFATSSSGFDVSLLRSTRGWLERKIHQSSDGFPAWENWTTDQKRKFENVCGSLMEKLGYLSA
jgi:hypothetical protein